MPNHDDDDLTPTDVLMEDSCNNQLAQLIIRNNQRDKSSVSSESTMTSTSSLEANSITIAKLKRRMERKKKGITTVQENVECSHAIKVHNIMGDTVAELPNERDPLGFGGLVHTCKECQTRLGRDTEPTKMPECPKDESTNEKE